MCDKCVPALERIVTNLRTQNDGRTIHEVDTMRHIAKSLVSLQKKKIIDPSFVCSETHRLKSREIDYWKKFYQLHKSH
jgi:hypothetical protein